MYVITTIIDDFDSNVIEFGVHNILRPTVGISIPNPKMPIRDYFNKSSFSPRNLAELYTCQDCESVNKILVDCGIFKPISGRGVTLYAPLMSASTV